MHSGSAVFYEVQRFHQLWLILIVGLIAVPFWVGLLWQVVLGHEIGDKPAPDFVIVLLWLVNGVALPVFWYLLRLETRVEDGQLHLKFAPLLARTIALTDIKTYEACTYKPIRDYGGWGIRWAWRKGMAYNVSGNRGVQLELQDGRRLLIGSQQPEELVAAIAAQLR